MVETIYYYFPNNLLTKQQRCLKSTIIYLNNAIIYFFIFFLFQTTGCTEQHGSRQGIYRLQISLQKCSYNSIAHTDKRYQCNV